MSDVQHRDLAGELARAREVVVDFFAGQNEYHSTAESLQRYFVAYALAARP